MGPYYANIGPLRGPVRHGWVPKAVGVFKAFDDATPIGIAFWVGIDLAGIVLWRLVVHDVDVPGHWFIQDREFKPVP